MIRISTHSLSRRMFIAAAASAPLAAAAAPLGGIAAAPRDGADVRRFGAAGDGIRDCSGAFAAALAASSKIYVPAGVYLVDRIDVPSDRTIQTDGISTVFKQRSGIRDDVRLINIVGSDVRIGDCSVSGNIASDHGEQRHGIFLEASPTTGDLSNIIIGNVRGLNLRGDVICIVSAYGRTVSRVRIGAVHGSNILRNVVSICGGRDISVESISGEQVGMTHLDIEPDDYNGPVVGCTIGAVHGQFVQVAGQNRKAFVDQVRIGLLDLRAPASRSVPPYAPGMARADALTVRNIRSIAIDRLVAKGFTGAAIRQIWDPGALTDQSLHIATAELSDCSRDPRSGQAYVLGSPRATRLRIDRLAIEIARPGVDAIRDCKSVAVGRWTGRIAKGSRRVAETGPGLNTVLYAIGGAAVVAGGWRLAEAMRA